MDQVRGSRHDPKGVASGLVTEAYLARVASGELKHDRAQLAAAAALDDLVRRLERARLGAKSSALGWLFGRDKRPDAVRGLYIHGSVGRGKTMLMDLFHEALPGTKKRRAHFHDFMADVHGRIHAHRQRAKDGRGEDGDPIPAVAESIRAEARTLSFDEFAVNDVADAMILGRLFDKLFDLGVTLVATSNVAPRDLYTNGLQRSRFVPFIDRLEAQCEVMSLDAMGDYRQGAGARGGVWLVGGDRGDLDAAWARFADGEGEAASIERGSRSIPLPRATGVNARNGSAAMTTFEALCGRPLGASDYAALAGAYRTVLIEGVPVFAPGTRNEAKRFINLIDTLYDRGTRLVATAEGEPDDLVGTLTGTERFEFDRTASRLTEMRGRSWVERAE